MNVAHSARVSVRVGSNVVALVPVVMPCSTIQTTALVYQVLFGTSRNGLAPLGSGSPAARHKMVANSARFIARCGSKVVGLVPLMMPLSTAHWSAPA